MNSTHAQFQSFYDKYPHLKSKIQSSWGSAACRKILADSLLPDRQGRAGFPPADATMLFNILRKHDQLFPQHNPVKPGDPPFKSLRATKRPRPVNNNTGIELTYIIKILIVFGLVIIAIKQAIQFLK